MDYHPDYSGIGAYLRTSPELKAELTRRAELGLAVARALAPVLKKPRKDRVQGELAASGQVRDAGIGESARHDRMCIEVTFDPAQGYGAAATFPHRHPNPAARDYLLAAIPVIEKG